MHPNYTRAHFDEVESLKVNWGSDPRVIQGFPIPHYFLRISFQILLNPSARIPLPESVIRVCHHSKPGCWLSPREMTNQNHNFASSDQPVAWRRKPCAGLLLGGGKHSTTKNRLQRHPSPIFGRQCRGLPAAPANPIPPKHLHPLPLSPHPNPIHRQAARWERRQSGYRKVNSAGCPLPFLSGLVVPLIVANLVRPFRLWLYSLCRSLFLPKIQSE